MNFKNRFGFVAFAAIALSLLTQSSAVRADDASAQEMFEKAKTSFSNRSSSSLSSVEEAISILNDASAQAESTELKFDILILKSRAYYFKGTHTSGDENKKTIHKLGQNAADEADQLTTDYAESAYFAGINLARWGEANGIVSSLTQVPQLKKYMAAAQERVTRDDQDGESVDGFGPHRTLGRMYKKLPGIFGGSFSESVKHLEKAVQGAPTLALNVVYLADTLLKDGNGSQQAEGRRLLNDLISAITKDPSNFNPARGPETAEELQLARDVLNGKEI